MYMKIFIALLLLPLVSNAYSYDMQLPPIDPNFCDNNIELCSRIENYDNNKLPKFKFNDNTIRLNQKRTVFYILNTLDSYTTYQAVKHTVGKEVNPLLPAYPSASELFLHKITLITLYDYLGMLDDEHILTVMNTGLIFVVDNNTQILKEGGIL